MGVNISLRAFLKSTRKNLYGMYPDGVPFRMHTQAGVRYTGKTPYLKKTSIIQWEYYRN